MQVQNAESDQQAALQKHSFFDSSNDRFWLHSHSRLKAEYLLLGRFGGMIVLDNFTIKSELAGISVRSNSDF